MQEAPRKLHALPHETTTDPLPAHLDGMKDRMGFSPPADFNPSAPVAGFFYFFYSGSTPRLRAPTI